MKYLFAILVLAGCQGISPEEYKAQKEHEASCTKSCEAAGTKFLLANKTQGCRCEDK